jgi:long-subunit fatty acid transport protein
MKVIRTLLLLVFGFSTIFISAQDLSLGLSTGTAFYQGDVSEPSLLRLKDYNSVYGGVVKYQYNDKLSLRASFIKGTISGQDKNYTQIPWRQKRGFKFKSPITEILTSVEWDALNLQFGSRKRYKGMSVTLYAIGGIGYLKTDPNVDFNEPNAIYEQVNIDKLANYNRSHLSAGFGAGIKWQITPHQTLSFEGMNHTAFTDYLDGISNAAQPRFSDWYFISVLTLCYNFSSKTHGGSSIPRTAVVCPRF